MKMLYTLKWEGENPTLKQISEKLGVEKSWIDEKFGIIEVDPQENLYSIMIEESAVIGEKTEDLKGPFSNPRIEPFDLKE